MDRLPVLLSPRHETAKWRPGTVTGVLGPNGAGESTTLRMIVGLDRPTSGRVIVNGKPYAQHARPLAEVGVLLDARAVHPSRSAHNHLRALATTHGISARRVTEVIEMNGLRDVANERVSGLSLGMGQRLGMAPRVARRPAHSHHDSRSRPVGSTNGGIEMIELQIALDRMPLERARAIAQIVAPFADGVEVGTSLIKQYGMEAVRVVAEAARLTNPQCWTLADLKTVDDATTETVMALDAGASATTILGFASPASIRAALDVADERGCELVVDLMRLDQQACADLAVQLPAQVRFAAHVGKDDQVGGANPLTMLGSWSHARRLAIAGGLGASDIPALSGIPNLRLIVGSKVTGSRDVAAAVTQLDRARRSLTQTNN